MRIPFTVAGVVLAFCAMSCASPRPRTQVTVVVHVDDVVRVATQSVLVVVEGRGPRDADFVVTHSAPPVALPSEPLRIALVPQGEDSTRTYRVTVSALDPRGDELVRVRAISGFVAGSTREWHIFMTADCFRRLCDEDALSTCVRGNCEPATVPVDDLVDPELEAGPPDARPSDTGIDAYRIDAYRIDAGPRDTGIDANRIDVSGIDAGPRADTGSMLPPDTGIDGEAYRA